MKALFVHDHKFSVTPSGEVYSPGKLPYNAWQRYLREFDELVVVGRSKVVPFEKTSNLNLSSGKNVTFHLLPSLSTPRMFFLWRSKLIELLKEQVRKADAVIARTSVLGELSAGLARKYGKPCAIEVVGDTWNAYWNYGSIAGKFYAPIAWWKIKKCLSNAEFAIYVTREYLQHRYPCNGFCGYASNVDIASVKIDVLHNKLTRWDNEIYSLNNPFKIGMIGSLATRYKGLQVAIRSLYYLRNQGIAAELHVLGEGAKKPWKQEACKYGVQQQLYLHGIIPNGVMVSNWLDELDGYIQPSLTEGLPRALIEAMSRGLPALGSKCGGIPELLPADCLHIPGDYKTLAIQLTKMICEPAWRMQKAQRNFDEARNYYHQKIESQRDMFWRKFAENVRQKSLRNIDC